MAAQAVAPDSRGSVWRRWDPHVRFPGTVLNDQFGDTDVAAALEALAAAQPAIEVVGVTDYLVTDSFRRVLEAWEGGAGQSVAELFVNIELRLDVVTGKGHPLNLHLLCACDQVDEMDRFLSGLQFSYKGRPYRAEHPDLIALGRAHADDASLSEPEALRTGVNQFKISFEELTARFARDDWARSQCLVAVAGGATDGTSGVREPDGSFEARRREIERFAHVVFDGNPNQREFWLGDGVLDPVDIKATYGSLKLCLHGSDAHSHDRLGAPDQDRFTWLKGDPSFETLRQACIEPRDRSYIGASPPSQSAEHGRIKQLTIDSGDWFVQGSIPINPGLVAIIGARGSGKTAVADLVAAGAGSQVPFDNDRSFISRAGNLISGTVAAVEWTHGEVTTRDLGPDSAGYGDIPVPVRYLSQQFVDQLCAADGVSDELLREIERVVFNAWPPDERLGATDFEGLLEARLKQARTRQSNESEAIADLSDRISNERVLKVRATTQAREREELSKRVTTLEQESTALTSKADPKAAQRLALVSAALETREQQAQAASIQKQTIDALKQSVDDARDTAFPKYLATLREIHSAAGLDEASWQGFAIRFAGDVDATLDDAARSAATRHASIVGVQPSGVEGSLDHIGDGDLQLQSVAVLRVERDRIQALVGMDKARTDRLQSITQESSRHKARIAQLDAAINRAAEADARIDAMASERLTHYSAYFDALLEEEGALNALYAPLASILSTRTSASLAKLQFSVKRVVDMQSWAAAGEAQLDLRREGAFKGRGELQKVASRELLDVWLTGDGAAAAAAIRDFSNGHSASIRQQSRVEADDSDEHREWERETSRWLYSANHVHLNYSLVYDGIDIQRLSPGTRGIVLLLLYLAVDEQETIPLIIDQPEENLDPESVYTELVDLFRGASKRRQVIMVTHNANLVVNTDVDQVIVARCERVEPERLPELLYFSGGLEDPEVRAAVCQVLEGGAEAFRERARRLRLAL